MPARIANITIHAKEPIPLAHFWSAVMGYPAFTGWDDDEMAELRASGMTEAELEDRAEAWDGDPAHQRFYFSRYDHERRARNRMRAIHRDRTARLLGSVRGVRHHDARPRGQRVLPAVTKE